jgi:predicted transcriptional regulator
VKGGKYMPEITLDQLKEELKKDKIDDLEKFKELFKEFYKQLQKEQKDFVKYLEWAYEKSGRDADIKSILEDISGKNASDLIESLKRLGYSMQESLGEDFEKAGFRLLEQVRAGKRSDVMYGITRIFLANRQNLPDILNEAFKPYYSDELFKCFMFTFLSSAIKPKENNKEE